VLIGRKLLRSREIQGFLINNRISNVGVETGEEDSRKLMAGLSELMGGAVCFPASTGIIGWRLPVEEMLEALPSLKAGLQGGSVLPVAEAVMTTDAYPKVRSAAAGQGRIVGIVKGAGMIEPNMATMLAFIMTDVSISRGALRRCLKTCVKRTFNRISVDGDQSTSDGVYLISSGVKPSVPRRDFEEALFQVCRSLAGDVVRNGEGTTHVIRVAIKGAPSKRIAEGAGRAIINSPLVKTAIFGNDPNLGRLLSALGDYMGSRSRRLDRRRLAVEIGGEPVFRDGGFLMDGGKSARLSGYLAGCSMREEKKGYPEHEKTVDIGIDMGCGRGEAELLGSDLSYGYIKENAEYTS
jgi:glutamate N-acetyltransferase/amino-acid N-acetyltransferase